MSKVWRVADLSLTGPLALPFAFFHCLDTPVLPHFILLTFPLRPTSRSHVSQILSQFRLPLADPLTDPLTPHSSTHRSPHRPPHTSQFRSQIPLQTPSHLTDFSQILITDFSLISHRFILASAREPLAPHITKASTMFFNFGVSSKQPGSVAGGRKLQFYLVNCRFSHRQLPLRGERNL